MIGTIFIGDRSMGGDYGIKGDDASCWPDGGFGKPPNFNSPTDVFTEVW